MIYCGIPYSQKGPEKLRVLMEPGKMEKAGASRKKGNVFRLGTFFAFAEVFL